MSAERIARLIAGQGPLTVAQFMTEVLHDPKTGTYAAQDPIGRHFTTAPEISQIFGELCGLWVAQAWHDQGRPERPLLVELGPGRGTLMADALRAIAAALPEFLDDNDTVLVEVDPLLEARQREKLGTVVTWKKNFDVERGRPLYLIANEFFDCMAVHQFVKTEDGWHERMVTLADGALAFALSPLRADAMIPPDRGEAPVGGVYETSVQARTYARDIGGAIAAGGGAALIVDYGYGAPGFGETLQALAEGKFAQPLCCEGDLSAHVDFRAVADGARSAGAKAYGPLGQGDFLVDLGIAARAERLVRANPQEARAIAAAVERLVHPDKMGTLFKAMAICRPGDPPPPGFS